MECIPQELIDNFIDEPKGDEKPLHVCPLALRCLADRGSHRLFQKVVLPTAEAFARCCDLFPIDHSLQSCICGLEHKAFRVLKPLILASITNRSTERCNTIEVLAVGFETIAPTIKTMELAHWEAFLIVLI